MRKYRNAPLTPEEIGVIEQLVDKWDSEREIFAITWHSRNTIRKYKHKYLDRIHLQEKIQEWLDKYYGTPDIKIYTMNYLLVCAVIFVVCYLATLGLYFLINI